MSGQLHAMCESDFAGVLRLWQQTEGIGLNESDTPAQLSSCLRRNPGMSFVARDGGKIVGAVLCGHDGRCGYLHHLAVAKSHRRRGLGRKLVEMCLARLAEIEIQKCKIFRYANNADGEGFWNRNGWLNQNDLCVMQSVLNPLPSADGRTRDNPPTK
jgi:N-acetylglutamate synthase